ncbi:MAG: hypothetical protein C0424_07155 [Sphingobacteriaceae bacterium]|nr:hypothetical protein [Sphingobacteriaceae bacterium]
MKSIISNVNFRFLLTIFIVLANSFVFSKGNAQSLSLVSKGKQTFRLEAGGVFAYESVDLGSLGIVTVGEGFYPDSKPDEGCSQGILMLVSPNMNAVNKAYHLIFPNFIGQGLVSSRIKKVIKHGMSQAPVHLIYISGDVIVHARKALSGNLIGCNYSTTNSALISRPFVAAVRVAMDRISLEWVTMLNESHSHGQNESLTDVSYLEANENNFLVISSLIVNQANFPLSYISFINPFTGQLVRKQQIGGTANGTPKLIVTDIQLTQFAQDNKNTHLLLGGGEERLQLENRTPYFVFLGIMDIDSLLMGLNPRLKYVVLSKSQPFSLRSDGLVTSISLNPHNQNAFSFAAMDWGRNNDTHVRRGPAISYIGNALILSDLAGGFLINPVPFVEIQKSRASFYGNEVVGKSLFYSSLGHRMFLGSGRQNSTGYTGGSSSVGLNNFSSIDVMGFNHESRHAVIPGSAGYKVWNPNSLIELYGGPNSSFTSLLTTGAVTICDDYWKLNYECHDLGEMSFLPDPYFTSCVLYPPEGEKDLQTISFSKFSISTVGVGLNRLNEATLLPTVMFAEGQCSCWPNGRESFENPNVDFRIEKDELKEIPVSGVKVYPNPATNSVTIQVSSEGIWNVSIRNIDGKIVRQTKKKYESSNMECKFLLEDLPSGIYIVEANSEKNHFSQKLVLTR